MAFRTRRLAALLFALGVFISGAGRAEPYPPLNSDECCCTYTKAAVDKCLADPHYSNCTLYAISLADTVEECNDQAKDDDIVACHWNKEGSIMEGCFELIDRTRITKKRLTDSSITLFEEMSRGDAEIDALYRALHY